MVTGRQERLAKAAMCRGFQGLGLTCGCSAKRLVSSLRDALRTHPKSAEGRLCRCGLTLYGGDVA
jgi:hypothetical protein